jgi:hypothetical protein
MKIPPGAPNLTVSDHLVVIKKFWKWFRQERRISWQSQMSFGLTESSDMTAVCVHLSGRIVVSALLELAGERFRSREGREK